MNVRELIDTVEAKCDLMASQIHQTRRLATLGEVEGHIDDLRAVLGLPHDVPCCCGCGGDPLQKCSGCGGLFGDCCGSYDDGEFLCDDCRDDREEMAEENGLGEGDAVVTPVPMKFAYPSPYQKLSMAVQRGFHVLRGKGYECYADLLCCQTCGLSVIEGDKYVFWHSQDAQNAVRDGSLILSWGGDGVEVVEVMRAAGLEVEWDGGNGRRIVVRRRQGASKEVAA